MCVSCTLNFTKDHILTPAKGTRGKVCDPFSVDPVHSHMAPQTRYRRTYFITELTRITCMLLQKDQCKISLRMFAVVRSQVRLWSNRSYCWCCKHVNAAKCPEPRSNLVSEVLECSILRTSNADTNPIHMQHINENFNNIGNTYHFVLLNFDPYFCSTATINAMCEIDI